MFDSSCEKGPLSAAGIAEIFSGCADFERREVLPGLEGGRCLSVCWVDGLADGAAIAEDILRPLTEQARTEGLCERRLLELLERGGVYSCTVRRRKRQDELVTDLLAGFCCLIAEGAGEALRAVAASESLDGLRAAVEKPFATGGVHAQPRAGAEDNFTMRRIQAYMEENFADPNLSAASLAERFGVSASYLSRAFKRQTGDTPIDYLHKCRLNRAKALLRDTTASVKDIAQAVGYPDSGALLRQMRKYEGVTPGQYRASTLE